MEEAFRRLRLELSQDDERELAAVERRLHALSRMPANLLDTFTLADILDLAAYALSSANPASERFTK